MYRRVLIYNPVAGGIRRNPGLLDTILASLGGDVTAIPTPKPNSAAELASKEIERGTTQIIAFGGDGTFNEVANGMIGSAIPLAVIPGGTANVLCVELGLGSNAVRVARHLNELQPRRIAVGKLTNHQGSRHFLLMAGAGLDAHIVHTLNPTIKNILGKAAYWIGGFGSVTRRLPEFDLRANSHDRRCSFALVSRVRNYGGDLEIARSVRLTDPRFEVVAFEGQWAVMYLRYFGGVLLNRLKGMKGVTVLHTNAVEFGAGGPLQIDGEVAGHSPARMEIVRDALTLMMPPDYGSDAWT